VPVADAFVRRFRTTTTQRIAPATKRTIVGPASIVIEIVGTIQSRQGLRIASFEEVAYRRGYITAQLLEKFAKPLQNDSQDLLRAIAAESLTFPRESRHRLNLWD